MLDKSNLELDSLRCKEQLSQESSKRLQRQLRDVREELTGSEQRDADTSQQLREFEQRIELLESENATLVKDLSLALRRIEDLQVAMQGEMDTSDSDQDPHSVDRFDDFPLIIRKMNREFCLLFSFNSAATAMTIQTRRSTHSSVNASTAVLPVSVRPRMPAASRLQVSTVRPVAALI